MGTGMFSSQNGEIKKGTGIFSCRGAHRQGRNGIDGTPTRGPRKLVAEEAWS